ncbi:MAG: lysophospholipid acyltransferase family protein [Myxococcota bacterium]
MGWLGERLSKDARRPFLPPRPDGRWVARQFLSRDLDARVDTFPIADEGGHGFDAFGMSRSGIAFGLAFSRFLYDLWFRVRSHDIDRVPAEGPTIVAVNHSGFVPLDGLMVAASLTREGPIGRAPRAVVDHFVPNLPWVNVLFQRAGAIGGTRGNFHAVLDDGGMVVVFPEGTQGIGKGFAKRYQLQPFRPGHAELAIRHQATIVPTAVIGSEEAWPQIARLDGLGLFGAPYLPVPLTPLPLPVRHDLWYGEPIDASARFRPEQADDPTVVASLAREVQQAVADLVAKGLGERRWW